MEWIRLLSKNDTYFEETWEIYEQSFPIFEQRLLDDQVNAMLRNEFSFTAIVEDEQVIAMIGYWTWDRYQYVEHLAVHRSMRGRQIGTRILNDLAKQGKTIILEIDPPVDKLSVRRLHFYESVGFKLNDYIHIHPPYRKAYHGHELKVLSYEKHINKDIFQNFKKYLFETVMQFSQNELERII